MKKSISGKMKATLVSSAVIASCVAGTTAYAALQLIGSDKAAQIAMQQAGVANGVVVDNDIDFEDGVYEVEFVSGGTVYDYKVNATTGAAWPNGMSYLRTGAGQNTADIKVMTPSEAEKIALSNVKAEGAYVLKTEFEDEGFYEVEIIAGNTKYEYMVNAVTGDAYLKSSKYFQNISAVTGAKAMTAQEAEKAVLNDINKQGAYVVKNELDDGYIYEIDVVADTAKYEYKVNSVTGKIYLTDIEYFGMNGSYPVSNPVVSQQASGSAGGNFITVQEAKNAALSRVNESGARVAEVDFDDDDFKYEVKIIAGMFEYDVDVSAIDGTVYKVEKEHWDWD